MLCQATNAFMFKEITKRKQFAPSSPLVRWLSIRGLRFFYSICFSVMYALLVVLAGRGVWAFVNSDSEADQQFVIYLASALTVAASALLTKMLVGYWRDIDELESKMEQLPRLGSG